ncbi:unnamed protein product [Spodoptera exigua]|nr:unnamed protein product [Spodoptera exigua]
MAQVGTPVPSTEPLLLLPGNPYPIIWGEKTTDFSCRFCMKTFYNKIALQNHYKTQHDDEVINSDLEEQQLPARHNDQNINGLCGFKFIPLKKNNDEHTVERDGFILRTFSEDTTYLIIKIERNDLCKGVMKRTRLEGEVKRTQMKPKPPIDVRGPFTCTFTSSQRPDLQCRQIFFNCCDYSVHYREEHTKRRKAALRCQPVQDDDALYCASDLTGAPTANQIPFSYQSQVLNNTEPHPIIVKLPQQKM